MRAQQNPNPQLTQLFLIGLGICGTLLVLWGTRNYGAGLTSDSVSYVSTARELAKGNLLLAPILISPAAWPPLYAAILAVPAALLGLDPLATIPILNAALFGAIVYLSGLLFFRHLQSALFAVIGTVAVLISTWLVRVVLMAWTEPLFIFFVLVYLLAFDSDRTESSGVAFGLMTLAAGLACLTRYSGIALLPAGAASLLLFGRGTSRFRLRRAIAFALLAGLPVCLWLVRNYLVSGNWFGYRVPSIFPPLLNVERILAAVLLWFVPPPWSEQPVVIWIFGLGLVALMALVVSRNRTGLGALWERNGAIVLLLGFYIGFLLVSASTAAFDPIDNRLLAPMFIPILVLVLAALEKAQAGIAALAPPRAVGLVIGAFLLLWLFYLVRETRWNLIVFSSNGGSGYNGAPWRTSDTIQYLRSHPNLASECALYSNGSDAVYILTGMRIKSSPRKLISNSVEPNSEGAELAAQWGREGGVCLIWLDKIKRDYVYTPAELKDFADVEPIVELTDGTLYAVKQK